MIDKTKILAEAQAKLDEAVPLPLGGVIPRKATEPILTEAVEIIKDDAGTIGFADVEELCAYLARAKILAEFGITSVSP